MSIKIDWKFWVVLLATLAGVFGPLWLWRFDLNARELSVELQSSSSLTPAPLVKGLSLQILVAGQPLTDAYASTLIVKNSGAKPILASDFEGPLDIASNGRTTLLWAQVSQTKPKSLTPVVSIEKNKVRLQPLLLNPGDSISLYLLNSDGKPAFSAAARVAGISDVLVTEVSDKAIVSSFSWAMALLAPFAVAGVFILVLRDDFSDFTIRFPAVMLTSGSVLAIATFSVAHVWNAYFGTGLGNTVVLAIALTFSGGLIAYLSLKKRQ